MSMCRYGVALFDCSQFPLLKQQARKRRRRRSSERKPNLNFSPISYLSNGETRYSIPISAKEPSPIVLSRRLLTHSVLAAWILPSCSVAIGGGGREALELERYTDPKDGFTFLRPSSWIKVEKAGATVLFEQDAKQRSNNVGVVVSPVRITSLRQFGSPQFVADKLIQAERQKESTKEAEVVAVSERRSGKGGIEVYEFEYRVDSSRGGMKRIFSAAFVSSNKLYLLNISHSDGLENPLAPERRNSLLEVDMIVLMEVEFLTKDIL